MVLTYYFYFSFLYVQTLILIILKHQNPVALGVFFVFDLCSCEFTNSFKIEADFVADAIWCNQCGENLDIEDFPIKDYLKSELDQWTGLYKKISINEHNSIGEQLTEKVKVELGTEYTVVFSPAR